SSRIKKLCYKQKEGTVHGDLQKLELLFEKILEKI
ncbi:MAG: hypothetical protein Q620_VSAC00888G0002, partial [Veillonella sp. DORA_A_3_16_22]